MGVKRDVAKVVSLYKRAIEEGSDHDAMLGFGTFLGDGTQ